MARCRAGAFSRFSRSTEALIVVSRVAFLARKRCHGAMPCRGVLAVLAFDLNLGLFKPRLGLLHGGEIDGAHQRVAVVPPATFLGATVVLRPVVNADPCPLGDVEVRVALDFLNKRFDIHRPHHNSSPSEIKPQSEMSQKSNRGTWHGPCF